MTSARAASFFLCYSAIGGIFLLVPFFVTAQTNDSAGQTCSAWWDKVLEARNAKPPQKEPSPPTCKVNVSCNGSIGSVSGKCEQRTCKGTTGCDGKPLEGVPDQKVDGSGISSEPPKSSELSSFTPSDQPLTGDPNKFTPDTNGPGQDPNSFFGKPIETVKANITNSARVGGIADSLKQLGSLSSFEATNPFANSNAWNSFSQTPNSFSGAPYQMASVRPSPFTSGFNAAPLFSPESAPISGGSFQAANSAPPSPFSTNSPFPWQSNTEPSAGTLSNSLSSMWESAKATAQEAWNDIVASYLTPPDTAFNEAENAFPIAPEGGIPTDGVMLSSADQLMDQMNVSPSSILPSQQSPQDQLALQDFANDVLGDLREGEQVPLQDLVQARAAVDAVDERGLFARMADGLGFQYSDRARALSDLDSAITAEAERQGFQYIAENAVVMSPEGNQVFSALGGPGYEGRGSGMTGSDPGAAAGALAEARELDQLAAQTESNNPTLAAQMRADATALRQQVNQQSVPGSNTGVPVTGANGADGTQSGDTYTALDAHRDAVGSARQDLAAAQAKANAEDTWGNRIFNPTQVFQNQGSVEAAQAKLDAAQKEYDTYRADRTILGSNANTQVPGQNTPTGEKTFGTQNTPTLPSKVLDNYEARIAGADRTIAAESQRLQNVASDLGAKTQNIIDPDHPGAIRQGTIFPDQKSLDQYKAAQVEAQAKVQEALATKDATVAEYQKWATTPEGERAVVTKQLLDAAEAKQTADRQSINVAQNGSTPGNPYDILRDTQGRVSELQTALNTGVESPALKDALDTYFAMKNTPSIFDNPAAVANRDFSNYIEDIKNNGVSLSNISGAVGSGIMSGVLTPLSPGSTALDRYLNHTDAGINNLRAIDSVMTALPFTGAAKGLAASIDRALFSSGSEVGSALARLDSVGATAGLSFKPSVLDGLEGVAGKGSSTYASRAETAALQEVARGNIKPYEFNQRAYTNFYENLTRSDLAAQGNLAEVVPRLEAEMTTHGIPIPARAQSAFWEGEAARAARTSGAETGGGTAVNRPAVSEPLPFASGDAAVVGGADIANVSQPLSGTGGATAKAGGQTVLASVLPEAWSRTTQALEEIGGNFFAAPVTNAGRLANAVVRDVGNTALQGVRSVGAPIVVSFGLLTSPLPPVTVPISGMSIADISPIGSQPAQGAPTGRVANVNSQQAISPDVISPNDSLSIRVKPQGPIAEFFGVPVSEWYYDAAGNAIAPVEDISRVPSGYVSLRQGIGENPIFKGVAVTAGLTNIVHSGVSPMDVVASFKSPGNGALSLAGDPLAVPAPFAVVAEISALNAGNAPAWIQNLPQGPYKTLLNAVMFPAQAARTIISSALNDIVTTPAQGEPAPAVSVADMKSPTLIEPVREGFPVKYTNDLNPILTLADQQSRVARGNPRTDDLPWPGQNAYEAKHQAVVNYTHNVWGMKWPFLNEMKEKGLFDKYFNVVSVASDANPIAATIDPARINIIPCETPFVCFASFADGKAAVDVKIALQDAYKNAKTFDDVVETWVDPDNVSTYMANAPYLKAAGVQPGTALKRDANNFLDLDQSAVWNVGKPNAEYGMYHEFDIKNPVTGTRIASAKDLLTNEVLRDAAVKTHGKEAADAWYARQNASPGVAQSQTPAVQPVSSPAAEVQSGTRPMPVSTTDLQPTGPASGNEQTLTEKELSDAQQNRAQTQSGAQPEMSCTDARNCGTGATLGADGYPTLPNAEVQVMPFKTINPVNGNSDFQVPVTIKKIPFNGTTYTVRMWNMKDVWRRSNEGKIRTPEQRELIVFHDTALIETNDMFRIMESNATGGRGNTVYVQAYLGRTQTSSTGEKIVDIGLLAPFDEFSIHASQWKSRGIGVETAVLDQQKGNLRELADGGQVLGALILADAARVWNPAIRVVNHQPGEADALAGYVNFRQASLGTPPTLTGKAPFLPEDVKGSDPQRREYEATRMVIGLRKLNVNTSNQEVAVVLKNAGMADTKAYKAYQTALAKNLAGRGDLGKEATAAEIAIAEKEIDKGVETIKTRPVMVADAGPVSPAVSKAPRVAQDLGTEGSAPFFMNPGRPAEIRPVADRGLGGAVRAAMDRARAAEAELLESVEIASTPTAVRATRISGNPSVPTNQPYAGQGTIVGEPAPVFVSGLIDVTPGAADDVTGVDIMVSWAADVGDSIGRRLNAALRYVTDPEGTEIRSLAESRAGTAPQNVYPDGSEMPDVVAAQQTQRSPSPTSRSVIQKQLTRLTPEQMRPVAAGEAVTLDTTVPQQVAAIEPEVLVADTVPHSITTTLPTEIAQATAPSVALSPFAMRFTPARVATVEIPDVANITPGQTVAARDVEEPAVALNTPKKPTTVEAPSAPTPSEIKPTPVSADMPAAPEIRAEDTAVTTRLEIAGALRQASADFVVASNRLTNLLTSYLKYEKLISDQSIDAAIKGGVEARLALETALDNAVKENAITAAEADSIKAGLKPMQDAAERLEKRKDGLKQLVKNTPTYIRTTPMWMANLASKGAQLTEAQAALRTMPGQIKSARANASALDATVATVVDRVIANAASLAEAETAAKAAAEKATQIRAQIAKLEVEQINALAPETTVVENLEGSGTVVMDNGPFSVAARVTDPPNTTIRAEDGTPDGVVVAENGPNDVVIAQEGELPQLADTVPPEIIIPGAIAAVPFVRTIAEGAMRLISSGAQIVARAIPGTTNAVTSGIRNMALNTSNSLRGALTRTSGTPARTGGTNTPQPSGGTQGPVAPSPTPGAAAPASGGTIPPSGGAGGDPMISRLNAWSQANDAGAASSGSGSWWRRPLAWLGIGGAGIGIGVIASNMGDNPADTSSATKDVTPTPGPSFNDAKTPEGARDPNMVVAPDTKSDTSKEADKTTDTSKKDDSASKDTSKDVPGDTTKKDEKSDPPRTDPPAGPRTDPANPYFGTGAGGSGGSGGSGGGGFLGGGMNLLSGLWEGLKGWFTKEEEQTTPQSQQPNQPQQPAQKPVGAIVGNPSMINDGDTTTLSWSTVGTDVSSSTCAVITADFTVIGRGGQNGNMTSPALMESTRFGLVCNVSNAKDKLLNETLVRVRGDDTDPPRIFSEEQVAASQASSANPLGNTAAGTGGGTGGQSGNPTPEDVRTCDPEQAMDSFIRCLCEAEPNPNGCTIPPGGLR